MAESIVLVFTQADLAGERPYPYTRTTRKQQYVDDRWARYKHTKQRLAYLTKLQMTVHQWAPIPRGIPLSVRAYLYTGREETFHDRDADNEFKGYMDALQGIAFGTDAWIDDFKMIRIPSAVTMLVLAIRPVTYDWLKFQAPEVEPGDDLTGSAFRDFLTALSELEL